MGRLFHNLIVTPVRILLQKIDLLNEFSLWQKLLINSNGNEKIAVIGYDMRHKNKKFYVKD